MLNSNLYKNKYFNSRHFKDWLADQTKLMDNQTIYHIFKRMVIH